jgi:membrane protein required for colicin V production
MTWFDYGVLIIVGLSLLWSIFRGFVRELVSVLGWISGFVLAMAFTQALASQFPPSLGPFLSALLAFLAILLLTWLASGLIGFILARAVQAVGLGWADRFLGALFGLTRGLVIVLILVMLGGLTPLPREPFWRNAILAAPLESAALLARSALPQELAERIRFGRGGAPA